jgi:hypothetical protein
VIAAGKSRPDLTTFITRIRLAFVRRLASISLMLCFVALGTGTLEYLHNLDHLREDAREANLLRKAGLPVSPQKHDESNCAVHAQLHLPILNVGWVPLLVFLGLFVAFLSLLATPLIPRPVPAWIDCRGPPLCS